MSTSRCDILVLPADSPPSEEALKRSLLFFDSVTLTNPLDRAMIHEREVMERTGDFTQWWSERNPFPRVPSYVDEMEHMLAEALPFRSRGILRTTSAKYLPSDIAALNYSAWYSAITHEELVRAVVPDLHLRDTPPLPIDGYLSGPGSFLKFNGIDPQYSFKEEREAVFFPNADERWSLYAHLRLGRALKFLSLSSRNKLVPMAFDVPNQQLLAQQLKFDEPIAGNFSTRNKQGDLINRAIFDFAIFEPRDLSETLCSMSWADVRKLRKHTLPGMSKLRFHLERHTKARKLASGTSSSDYQTELLRLQDEFQTAKEEVAASWEKLRIAAVFKAGGGTGATTLAGGLLGPVTGVTWADILLKILASGLVTTSLLTHEFQSLLPARSAVKRHPLYFIDHISETKRDQ